MGQQEEKNKSEQSGLQGNICHKQLYLFCSDISCSITSSSGSAATF